METAFARAKIEKELDEPKPATPRTNILQAIHKAQRADAAKSGLDDMKDYLRMDYEITQ